jgi:HSP20 family protein
MHVVRIECTRIAGNRVLCFPIAGGVAFDRLGFPSYELNERHLNMSKSKTPQDSSAGDLGGFLGGLTNLIEKLGDLAEKGKDLQETKQFGDPGRVQGVYGFSIRTGLGGQRSGGVKVEPFGNVRTDERTGRATVQEVMEPLVDVFEEAEHVLVVAELPGVSAEDVRLELRDDILTIAAERGAKKYRKEVLLPASFAEESMSRTCRNGILEVKLAR